MSTVDPEARQHQAALQSTMQAFLKLMRSDDHGHSKYIDYIKDVKFLVDSLVPQLSGHEVKDVAKMIMTTIKIWSASFYVQLRVLKLVTLMKVYLMK